MAEAISLESFDTYDALFKALGNFIDALLQTNNQQKTSGISSQIGHKATFGALLDRVAQTKISQSNNRRFAVDYELNLIAETFTPAIVSKLRIFPQRGSTPVYPSVSSGTFEFIEKYLLVLKKIINENAHIDSVSTGRIDPASMRQDFFINIVNLLGSQISDLPSWEWGEITYGDVFSNYFALLSEGLRSHQEEGKWTLPKLRLAAVCDQVDFLFGKQQNGSKDNLSTESNQLFANLKQNMIEIAYCLDCATVRVIYGLL